MGQRVRVLLRNAFREAISSITEGNLSPYLTSRYMLR